MHWREWAVMSPTTHVLSPMSIFRCDSNCLTYFGAPLSDAYVLMNVMLIFFVIPLITVSVHHCLILPFLLEIYFIRYKYNCIYLRCHLLAELFSIPLLSVCVYSWYSGVFPGVSRSWILFPYPTDTLCLFIGEFSPLTFRVVFDI